MMHQRCHIAWHETSNIISTESVHAFHARCALHQFVIVIDLTHRDTHTTRAHTLMLARMLGGTGSLVASQHFMICLLLILSAVTHAVIDNRNSNAELSTTWLACYAHHSNCCNHCDCHEQDLPLPRDVPGGQSEFRRALPPSFLFKVYHIVHHIQMKHPRVCHIVDICMHLSIRFAIYRKPFVMQSTSPIVYHIERLGSAAVSAHTIRSRVTLMLTQLSVTAAPHNLERERRTYLVITAGAGADVITAWKEDIWCCCIAHRHQQPS